MSYWENLSDEELEEEFKRNQRRKLCIDKKERAIAKKNLECILKEKGKRFERRFGL